MGRRKADGKLIFQKLFNISHTIIFNMNFIKSSYGGVKCVVDFRSGAVSCEGVETLLSFTTHITLQLEVK